MMKKYVDIYQIKLKLMFGVSLWSKSSAFELTVA